MTQDMQLRHDVQGQLEWEPALGASRIGIAAKEHVVTLTGSVSSFADKLRVENVVKRINGVKAVANDLEVKLAGSLHRISVLLAGSVLRIK